MDDCLFCKMVRGEIEPSVVFEDDKVLAFRDINPKAPVHVLVIPKKHVSTITDLKEKDFEYLVALQQAVKEIVKKENIEDSGFRVVINSGQDAGQEVLHLHFHILGGRRLSWPPG